MAIINNKLNGDAVIRLLASANVELFDLARPFGNTKPGTIAVTSGSNAVTGSNTLFQRDFAVGDWLYIYSNSSFNETREVSTITSNTAMTFTSTVTTTNSAAPYDTAEKVEWASLVGVKWCVTGNAQINRGGTKILELNGADHWDFRDSGGTLSEGNTGNFAVTISGTGSVFLHVSKKSRLGSNNSIMV
jgi:hypothetical protein